MLSLGLGWVKVIPGFGTEGNSWRSSVWYHPVFNTIVINGSRLLWYGWQGLQNWSDLLRAISWQESRFKIDAIGRNPVTGYGSGLMQIDSQHFNELSRYGIKPDHLLSDACLNIYTGAYYLAQAFKKWGVSWDAVGAYNAGFKRPRASSKTLRVCEEDPLLLHGYQSKQTNFF